MDFRDYKKHFRKFDDFNDRHGKNNPHKHNDNFYFDKVTEDSKKEDVKVKEWYVKEFPKDILGEGIPETLTFEAVYEHPEKIYELLAPADDSLIRERVFEKVAELKNVDYDEIYNRWLESSKVETSEVKNLEWKIMRGKDLGYDTGDNPTAVLDLGIAQLTLSYAPYKDSRKEEYFAELDFEAGAYEVAEEPDPWKAIKVVLKNYISPETIPDIPEDILEALYQEVL